MSVDSCNSEADRGGEFDFMKLSPKEMLEVIQAITRIPTRHSDVLLKDIAMRIDEVLKEEK